MLAIIEAVNDVLDVVNRRKRAERLDREFPEGVRILDVGKIAVSEEVFRYLDQLGVWAALEAAGEVYADIKRLG